MREDYIVFKDMAVCRFCGTLLSRDIESVPACECGQNKKRGREMKKIAREVLMMIDTQYGTTPKCVEIMTGNSEQEILEAAQSKYGKVHLFPCRLDATIDDANKPHDNKKMRGYGGFGI